MSGNSGSVSDCQQTLESRHLDAEAAQMRNISFILAFAFLLAGPSVTGVPDRGLPGVGTFSYNGFPVVPAAPRTILLAAN
jgi:hypothetical protein